jgi:hypothetical protein
MSTDSSQKQTIGRAEVVALPEQGVGAVHARIDTGARTSAIWASYAQVEGDKLAVILFDKGHRSFTGNKIMFDEFSRDIVTSSTGHKDLRYKVKLLTVIGGRKIRASYTLADRSTQVYSVLIGRNVLRGKFIVDVKTGTVLADKEKELYKQKQVELSTRTDS